MDSNYQDFLIWFDLFWFVWRHMAVTFQTFLHWFNAIKSKHGKTDTMVTSYKTVTCQCRQLDLQSWPRLSQCRGNLWKEDLDLMEKFLDGRESWNLGPLLFNVVVVVCNKFMQIWLLLQNHCSYFFQCDPTTPNLRAACHNILLVNMREGSQMSTFQEFGSMVNQCLLIFWRSLPEGNVQLDLNFSLSVRSRRVGFEIS